MFYIHSAYICSTYTSTLVYVFIYLQNCYQLKTPKKKKTLKRYLDIKREKIIDYIEETIHINTNGKALKERTSNMI